MQNINANFCTLSTQISLDNHANFGVLSTLAVAYFQLEFLRISFAYAYENIYVQYYPSTLKFCLLSTPFLVIFWRGFFRINNAHFSIVHINPPFLRNINFHFCLNKFGYLLCFWFLQCYPRWIFADLCLLSPQIWLIINADFCMLINSGVKRHRFISKYG